MVAADPAAAARWPASGWRRHRAAPPARGNELVLQPEHPRHPRWGEGPWLLCPAGPGTGSAARPGPRCGPSAARSASGWWRELSLAACTVTQETLLWDGADRGWSSAPTWTARSARTGCCGCRSRSTCRAGCRSTRPRSSVIGRPPGPTDTDVAEHSFTLDSPASEWFGRGLHGHGRGHRSAASSSRPSASPRSSRRRRGGRRRARALIAALAGQGVTATCSLPDGPRYGYLASSTPTCPTSGSAWAGPAANAFTAAVLAVAGPGYAAGARGASCATTASARLWVPAARSRADAFAAGADLRGPCRPAGPDRRRDGPTAGRRDPRGSPPTWPTRSSRSRPGRAAGPATAGPDVAGRARHRAGRAHRRAAEPRHAERPGHPRRHADDGADAGVQHLAVRSLDRRPEADRARTAPASPGSTGATPSSTRWPPGPATGARPGSPRRARTTTTSCWRSTTGLHAGPLPASAAWPASSRRPRCCPRSSRAATRWPRAGGGAPSPADGVTVRLRDAGAGPGGRPGRPVHRPGRGPRPQPDARTPAASRVPLRRRRGHGRGARGRGGHPRRSRPRPGRPRPAADPAEPGRGRPGRPSRPSRSTPATGCTARDPRRPATCRSPCTCRPRELAVDSAANQAAAADRGLRADPAAGEIRLAIPPGLDVRRRPGRCATTCRPSATRSGTWP